LDPLESGFLPLRRTLSLAREIIVLNEGASDMLRPSGLLRRTTLLFALGALLVATAARAAEDKFFDSNGVKIHYLTEGKGEPVILIHGFTASVPVQWQLPGIFTKLAKDYQVIAIDNRGHGRSDKPHDPKQYGPEMVQDVIRLMDHLKLDKAHIVGYSMGGFMTGYMIANHPERILSATMGGAGWSEANDPRLDFIEDLAKSLDEGKGIGPLIIQLTPADRPKPTEEEMAGINKMLMLMNDSKALAACIRGMKGLAVPEEKLKANQVPVLAIIGDKDPLKAGVDEMQARMANLTVSVITGADHMTTFTNAKFVEDLKAHLAAHSQSKAPVAVGAGAE
jgi:pimeloyl-ACP methyl ester carboxylesterase